MRTYRYVGPKGIADRATVTPAGTSIHSAADVIRWARESGQHAGPDGYIIATFVVDAAGVLLVADRRSEHVACAGRKPVQSAGEITFLVAGTAVEVIAASNQSTGYCPEPESWPAVAAVLSAAGMNPPDGFSLGCEFRRCVRCGGLTLVKERLFRCGVCGADLPLLYNCQ